MPGRDIRKSFVPNSYYHVYLRGVDKEPIYRSNEDRAVFLGILKKYLSPEDDQCNVDFKKYKTKNYSTRIELLAYCLMGNHFHFHLYQHDETAMSEFMKSLLTSYSMYFNKIHSRRGPVFEHRYKAAYLKTESHFMQISRYIHRNPADYLNYEWSSIDYYLNGKQSQWVKPKRILEMFTNTQDYFRYLQEYKDTQEEKDGPFL